MYCKPKALHTSLLAENSLMAFLSIIHLQCRSADVLMGISGGIILHQTAAFRNPVNTKWLIRLNNSLCDKVRKAQRL